MKYNVTEEVEIMGIKIQNQRRADEEYPQALTRVLPQKILDGLYGIHKSIRIEEIRLRSGSLVVLTTSCGNIFLESVITQKEIMEIFESMCDHSLYAHAQTINRGYITLEGGIRVGICGRASFDGDRIIGVYDISGLNIRLPSGVLSVGTGICDMAASGKSVLIYSPPGVGKTTLLRSLAYRLAGEKYAKRVVVIDTRGELGVIQRDRRATIDILSGYPLKEGIEIASRTMNAQLMVCDEIGSMEECASIIEAQNCGVPLLASAHGDNILGLLSRSGILKLHRAGVFSYYVRIGREGVRSEYKYLIHSAKEANDILEANGVCINNL